MSEFKAPIAIRYGRALERLRRDLKTIKQRDRKEFEVEISHIQHQIEQYGFKFAPDLYLDELVTALEEMQVTGSPSAMARAAA